MTQTEKNLIRSKLLDLIRKIDQSQINNLVSDIDQIGETYVQPKPKPYKR